MVLLRVHLGALRCSVARDSSCGFAAMQRTQLPMVSPAQRSRRGRVQVTRGAASTTELPPNLKKIVGAFQMVPDELARYKQLLFLAAKLPPLPHQFQSSENQVQGCVSKVWVVGELENGTLKWQADSDSQLTKGLAALLVQGLGGCSPEQVLAVDPAGIIESLGLKQKLTPSRNNGFLNMFRLMQQKAAQLSTGQGDEATSSNAASNGASSPTDDLPASGGASSSRMNARETSTLETELPAASRDQPSDDASTSTTPVQDSMRRKIQQALQPTRLAIVDESSQHAGHVGSRMKPGYSGETHFNVSVVSPLFDGQNTVKRHRAIYGLLKEELAGTVHALSLVTRTPAEDNAS